MLMLKAVNILISTRHSIFDSSDYVRMRARHSIFEIFSVSLNRLQHLNDLSSTNDSIVPAIRFAFNPDFTCGMCI